MNLTECLNSADIATLRKVADHYALPATRHSKLSLIQELLFAFRNRAFMEEHMPRWIKPREHAMLRMCMQQRSVFSVEELERLLQSADGTASTVESAVEEGWLYPSTRHGGRQLYYMPDELRNALRMHVVEAYQRRVRVSDDGPLTYRDEGQAMARDLDVFLEYAKHHDVRLTTDGSMYKRNLQQVMELFEIEEEPLQGGWRFGYGRRFHDYPDRLALLYDCAYHHHYVEERDEGLLVVTDGAEEWFAAGPLERQKTLLKFYMQLYRRPVARLPQIVQLVAHIAVPWVDSQSMFEALDPFVNDYYYDNKQQVWQARIVKMLMHLGVLRVGSDEEGREWFQMTKLGQQLITSDAAEVPVDDAAAKNRILIVQPNFEIVVTADQPLVTADLANFAELRQSGVIRVYRVTEESVQRGLTNGHSLSGWLGMLQSHAQTPVPGNVERTLSEWERSLSTREGTASS